MAKIKEYKNNNIFFGIMHKRNLKWGYIFTMLSHQLNKIFISIPITTISELLKKTFALSNFILSTRIKFALKTVVQYHTNKSVKKPNNLNLGIRSTIIKIAHLS